MVPGYRAPRRRSFWEKHAKLRGFLLTLAATVFVFSALVAGDLALVSSKRFQVLASAAAYQPKQITRLVSPDGETVAEVAAERRIVLPHDEIPQLVTKAIVAKRDPAFFTRRSLGTIDMIHAIADRVRGRAATSPLSVELVQRLAPGGGSLVDYVTAWYEARQLERDLARPDIADIYMNEVLFGAGRFGIAEAARSWFDLPAAQLDAKQAATLAEKANRSDGPPPVPPTFSAAPGCGAAAAAELKTRLDAAALARLGRLTVTTTCDPALSKIVDQIVAKQNLAASGLHAAAVVMRLPTHEIAALTGDVGVNRPLGNLRLPLVFAAALASLKFTTISPLDDRGDTLRTLAAMSPAYAADALFRAGVLPEQVAEVASHVGLHATSDAAGLAHGSAPVSLLEAATIFATFVDLGQERQPQILRKIGDQPESDAAKLLVKAVTPEVAYLSLSLSLAETSQRHAPLATPSTKKSTAPTTHASDAWTALGTPDAVVVAWVGYPDSHTLPMSGEGERASVAIAHGILSVLLHGKPQPLLPRPTGLVERRVDSAGHLLPSSTRGGVPEYFVPGSLPKEDAILPPERDRDTRDRAPADEDDAPR